MMKWLYLIVAIVMWSLAAAEAVAGGKSDEPYLIFWIGNLLCHLFFVRWDVDDALKRIEAMESSEQKRELNRFGWMRVTR